MAKIVGPSGVVVVVDDLIAASLVNEGDAEYVKETPAPKKPKSDNK